ncbi:MAG: alpha/beta hydrolase [Actinomycetia bacterium]|nr:alpha/beta hydrolase [Actinomycetes bacterium]
MPDRSFLAAIALSVMFPLASCAGTTDQGVAAQGTGQYTSSSTDAVSTTSTSLARADISIMCDPTSGSGCLVPTPNPDEQSPLIWKEGLQPEFANISYGSDPAQELDIYPAESSPSRGTIVAIHGGGFVGGDRSMMTEWFGPIVKQLDRGFAIVNIEYRHTDGAENPFPAAVEDTAKAINWVRANASTYNLNVDTLIVAGHSAGATLATLAGVATSESWTNAPDVEVDGYVSFAAIMDFASPSMDDANRGWLGSSLDPNATFDASPVDHVEAADPPGFIAHGDQDGIVPVSQSEEFVSKADQAGVPSERVWFDKVTTGDPSCRNHVCMCGVNSAALDQWFDLVANGEI